MQALRRRYQQAQQRVSRRQSRYNAKRTAAAARVLERKTVLRNDTRRYNIGIDRQQRWEEWFLGPLRTGGEAGVGKDGKGAGELLVRKDLSPELKFNHQDTRLLKKMADKVATKKRKRHKIVKAKLSVPRKADVGPENFVVTGDRVVVRALNGPMARYRGKIGTIVGLDRKRKLCVIEGMTIRQSRALKVAPYFKLFSEANFDPDCEVLLPMPFSQIRPVKTITNSAGQKEDVILGKISEDDLFSMGRGAEIEEELLAEDENRDVQTASSDSSGPESDDQRTAREMSEQNLSPEQIEKRFPPRPSDTLEETASKSNLQSKDRKKGSKGEDEDADKKDLTTPADTLRIERDAQTWIPTLLRAPLPSPIIDELRGKYSIFRTRHEPEYVKRLQRADSARQRYEAWARSGGGVLDTPRKEAAMKAQAERKGALRERGRVLDDEILEGIGKMMWEGGMRLSPQQEFEAAKRWKQTYGGLPKAIESDSAAAKALGAQSVGTQQQMEAS